MLFSIDFFMLFGVDVLCCLVLLFDVVWPLNHLGHSSLNCLQGAYILPIIRGSKLSCIIFSLSRSDA